MKRSLLRLSIPFREPFTTSSAVITARELVLLRVEDSDGVVGYGEAAPFEREFKGLLKFEPLSRSHDGLVDILQIGRRDDAGYFFYVMELADDDSNGHEIDPDTYLPKTLSSKLSRCGRLSVKE